MTYYRWHKEIKRVSKKAYVTENLFYTYEINEIGNV